MKCVAQPPRRIPKSHRRTAENPNEKEVGGKAAATDASATAYRELNRLFKRIYENYADGKLFDSRFLMLAGVYKQEQEELRENLFRLNEGIISRGNIGRFISKVRKYMALDELAPAVLSGMVKAVCVHALDQSKDYRKQQINISYNLVGISPRLNKTTCKT